MRTKKRKIAIATSTRADWGLLSGIARELRRRPDVEVAIIATNMHLDPRYGLTVNEIIADGFTVDERVEMRAASDSEADTARAMAQCLSGMADALERIAPDVIVILGDRYEMLAVASAATVMRIPIAHIAGGAISQGAIDDQIRHAITKLSTLHLTETEAYRQRVIQMGEDPAMVINTGAIGVYNIANETLLSREELERQIGWEFGDDALLVTMHPATADDASPGERIDALLEALDRFPSSRVLITYPNNDARGLEIIDRIEKYGSRNPDRVKVIPSLGYLRYLSALRCVGAVVGNSSSGIVEVPSAGIPTVDIGPRQRGRLAADSVIHCGNSADDIAATIAAALSPDFRARAAATVNPYYRPDTLQLITTAIATSPLPTKRFHDLPSSPRP